MRSAGAYILLYALAFGVCFISTPSVAQVLSGDFVMSGIPLAGAYTSIETSPRHTTDVLLGKNTPGPYTLAWKPIDIFSEEVSIDGRVLQRDLDYQFDYNKGILTFAAPVTNSQVIRVRYACDFSKAVYNKVIDNIPLTLDLIKDKNTSIQFLSAYKTSDITSGISSSSTMGFSGSVKSQVGEFNTMFLTSPGTESAGDMGDRSAIKLSGSTKVGYLSLSTSYCHTGKEFNASKEYKLKPGAELLDVLAVYSTGANLSISSSIKQTEISSSEGSSKTSTSTEHKLFIAPQDGTKMTATRTELESTTPNQSGSKTVTNQLQIEHELGSNITASAAHKDVTTASGDASKHLTTDEISLKAKPVDNVSLSSRFIKKDSSSTGEEESLNVNLNTTPVNRVKIDLKLAYANKDVSGSEKSHALKIVTNPRDDTMLELSLTGRDTGSLINESSRVFKLSTEAIVNTCIKVDWVEKQSEAQGYKGYKGVRLEAAPLKDVKILGGISEKASGGVTEVSREARVEVAPFEGTKVGGGYTETESDEGFSSKETDMSLSTRPVEFLAVSGEYTSREATSGSDQDSMKVDVELQTGKTISLTAGYSRNPENKSGLIECINSRSYGLISDLGRMRLKGKYTYNDEYLLGKTKQIAEMILDYRFSSDSQLTTGYCVETCDTEIETRTSVYSLTYAHKVGSKMNLYLSGKARLYGANEQIQTDMTEYQAEARLGLKF